MGELLLVRGDFDLARHWYEAAGHAAKAARDRYFSDIALASHAYLPAYSDDPSGVLDLILPRLQTKHSPSPAVAWLWAFAGKAHASLGERMSQVLLILGGGCPDASTGLVQYRSRV